MQTLKDQRGVWQSNSTLRAVYNDLYETMAAQCVEGDALEIGGGIGNFKAFRDDVVSSDIQPTDWLDVVCDAHRLPFGAASFWNVVLFDVLHHLERPGRALQNMSRVLRPGGRIVMVEPCVTPISGFFYRHFHQEPCDLDDDPLADGGLTPHRDPKEANQAIPTLIFGRHKNRFGQMFPELRIVMKRRLSLFAYPLSGGYRSWSLISAGMVRPILSCERVLMPVLGPIMAFRMIVVLERIAESTGPAGDRG